MQVQRSLWVITIHTSFGIHSVHSLRGHQMTYIWNRNTTYPRQLKNHLRSENKNKWNWNTYAVIFYRIRPLFSGDVRHSIMHVWNLHIWKHSHISKRTINQCIKKYQSRSQTVNWEPQKQSWQNGCYTKWWMLYIMDTLHPSPHPVPKVYLVYLCGFK